MKNLKKKIDEKFLKSEVSKIEDGDLDMVMKNNEEISDKITSTNILKRYKELAKAMFGMIKDYKKGIYHNVPWFTIAASAVALLYVLNPLDIVPDFIPGVGYVDDLTVFTLALKFVQSDIHKYLEWKTKAQRMEEAEGDSLPTTPQNPSLS